MRLFPATVLAAILVLMLAAPAAASGDPEPRLDEQILWMDAEQQFALFLPERVTASREVSELPLKAYQQRILQEVVDTFRETERTSLCLRDEPPPPQGSAHNPRSIEELLFEHEVVLVGRIEHLVAGWTPWTNHVITAAYVRIEELLQGQDVKGAPATGGRVATFYKGGQTTVAGTALCTERLEGYHVPMGGDLIVLAGKPWPADSQYFWGFVVFPVQDGEILPQPRIDLRSDALPVDLARVRRLVPD